MAFQLPPKLVQTCVPVSFDCFRILTFSGELHFAARHIFESQIAFRSFTLPRLGTICVGERVEAGERYRAWHGYKLTQPGFWRGSSGDKQRFTVLNDLQSIAFNCYILDFQPDQELFFDKQSCFILRSFQQNGSWTVITMFKRSDMLETIFAQSLHNLCQEFARYLNSIEFRFVVLLRGRLGRQTYSEVWRSAIHAEREEWCKFGRRD